MFVSSLRDGMNLVSFEFIACQSRQKSGVLVLSEFAGAAQALGAGALLVNPYNTDEVAETLHEAIHMSQKERVERYDYLVNHINAHTSQATPLQRPAPLHGQRSPRPPLTPTLSPPPNPNNHTPPRILSLAYTTHTAQHTRTTRRPPPPPLGCPPSSLPLVLKAWAEKFVAYLKYAQRDFRGAADYGPFSGLGEAKELVLRDVVASYKACERADGKRLLVFGLLGTLIDYSHFKNLEQLLPSVRRNLTTLANNSKNIVIVCRYLQHTSPPLRGYRVAFPLLSSQCYSLISTSPPPLSHLTHPRLLFPPPHASPQLTHPPPCPAPTLLMTTWTIAVEGNER